MSDSTSSDYSIPLITAKDLIETMKKMSFRKYPLKINKKARIFEKIMNKLGWYRSPEIFIVKDTAFKLSL